MGTLLLYIVCSFCGNDFVSLGRHIWRCKQRANQAAQNGQENTTELPATTTPTVIPTRTVVKCCCGKICKGKRGVKMHQCSCPVIQDIDDELCAHLEEQIRDNNCDGELVNETECNTNFTTVGDETPLKKRGIKLPKTDSQWATANEYFKSALFLNGPIRLEDLNASLQSFNKVIYNYFAENYGHPESS